MKKMKSYLKRQASRPTSDLAVDFATLTIITLCVVGFFQ